MRRTFGVVTANGWIVAICGIAAFVIAALTNYREALAIGVLMAILVVAAALWMSLRPTLAIQRFLVPAQVSEGETATAQIEITNQGRRRTTPLIADEYLADKRIPVALESIAGGGELKSSYEIPASHRGVYKVGPLRIAHTDPLRLMRLSGVEGAETSLHVLPRIHDVPPLPIGRVRDLEGEESGRTSRGGVAFHTLREYVPGDDLRLVHWRSTAKTGTMLVRENIATYEPRFTILLDTSAKAYESEEQFEDAVRISASLVSAGAKAQQEIAFVSTSGLAGYIDATGHGLARVLDIHAEVQLGDDPGFNSLTRLPSIRRGSGYLATVTGFPDAVGTDVLRRASGRFDALNIVQVTDSLERRIAVPGAGHIMCATSEEFAQAWSEKVR